MRVDLVKDKDTGQYIGYCISTIDKEMIGEIDSLYVEKENRKHGIGSQLMEKNLEWLDKNKVKSKIVAVGDGNENVIDFYNEFIPKPSSFLNQQKFKSYFNDKKLD